MKRFFSLWIYWALKVLMSFRYRVTIKGLDRILKELSVKEKKGLLILPTHVAKIDPIFAMLAFWPKLSPRPLVLDDFFYMHSLRFLMRILRALPCPNMEVGVNHWKLRQLKKVQEAIVLGLMQKETFLIYPSGKLKLASKEVLGGSSFVPTILKEVGTHADVMLVRITGLWGSRFSRALTGKVPSLMEMTFVCMKDIVQNLLFLTPKREVTIECELVPQKFYALKGRQEINQFLETWFNKPWGAKGEELSLVPTSIWNKTQPVLAQSVKEVNNRDHYLLSEEKKEKIIEQISRLSQVPKDKIDPAKDLIADLGLDSLDVAQLILFLEEVFHTKEVKPEDLRSVSDLFMVVLEKGEEDESLSALPSPGRLPFHLKKEKNRPPPRAPEGATIAEAFLKATDRMGRKIACADAPLGVWSYKKLKLAAILLAEKLKSVPGERVGVLLPSSTAAYLSIFALYLAGKIPVMLNWTLGVKALSHAAKAANFKVTLSSVKFLSRLKDLDLGNVEETVALLDDLFYELRFMDKVKAFFKSLLPAKRLLRHLKLDRVDPKDSAVILFTSGTQTYPKGVPLSHENILSNQTAAIKSIALDEHDLLYGVLPPFHSFGFSVTGLLPILTGLKVVYAPDPTAAKVIARDIEQHQVTLFCCAPSFIRGVFRVANPLQLKSLKYIVSGAEKAPDILFEYVQHLKPRTELLEGYGVTECSPIVTLSRPHEPKIGVGRALEGIELLIVDPESGTPLEEGKLGEVCIYGKSVFSGYLGLEGDPFLDYGGKRWYRSGDLGTLTPDGSLILNGRLKRFVKIGGEMVSLGGLEEEFLEIMQENHWTQLAYQVREKASEAHIGVPLALCAMEKSGVKSRLVLFTIYEVDRNALNLALRKRGYSNLVRLSEVRSVETIPLTGTGKTHYRILEESLS